MIIITMCDHCGTTLNAMPNGCRDPNCPRDAIEAALSPGVPDGAALWGGDLVTKAEYDRRARRHAGAAPAKGEG